MKLAPLIIHFDIGAHCDDDDDDDDVVVVGV
jgi:hypothetical protein